MAPDSEQNSTTSSNKEKPANKNVVRLYGSAWAECGYCHGDRASLATKEEAVEESNMEEKAGQEEQHQHDDGDDTREHDDSFKSTASDNSDNKKSAQVVVKSSKAYSVMATTMTPAMYESLICRGWRRSGRALYKPDNWNSCCPLLSIRLPVNQFAPTRAQRKLQRRMQDVIPKQVAALIKNFASRLFNRI